MRSGLTSKALCAALLIGASQVSALAQSRTPERALVAPSQQIPGSVPPGLGSPGATIVSPRGETFPLPGQPGTQGPQVSQAGQVALSLSARYGREPPAITSGLHWRVYTDKPDQTGTFRLVREDRGAAPTLSLPPGGYIVHVSLGLANTAKRVQLRSEQVREVFELPAGGARFEARVGDVRIPAGQVVFDVYKGSQFDPGDKRPLVDNLPTGDVVVLPEGVYHVVSSYGDGNAVMRSDLRVQAGKLTDTTMVHRAAKITLKLVSERGGEAIANTAWTVLTPGGDTIKESIGAFPVVILSEGDYVVIARNESRIFNGVFKVDAGVDREVEVVAR